MEIKIGSNNPVWEFTKTIIPFAIVGYELITTNSRYTLVGYFITSYPMWAHGIIVNNIIYSLTRQTIWNVEVDFSFSSLFGKNIFENWYRWDVVWFEDGFSFSRKKQKGYVWLTVSLRIQSFMHTCLGLCEWLIWQNGNGYYTNGFRYKNQEFRDTYKCSCCFSIDTIRSHVKTLGLYNFIRDFGWVYKWGGGGGI